MVVYICFNSFLSVHNCLFGISNNYLTFVNYKKCLHLHISKNNLCLLPKQKSIVYEGSNSSFN